MTLTDDIYLPTPEEIAHKEIPITSNYFITSAMWLGKYCDKKCKEYMLCRTEEGDPRKCLPYSRDVTECGLEFFKKVKRTCRDELEHYTKCIDFTGKEPLFWRCRHEQALFDGCMTDHGFERAKFGHFQMLRVLDSERPAPKPMVPMFKDATPPHDYWDPKNEKQTATGVTGHWWSIWIK